MKTKLPLIIILVLYNVYANAQTTLQFQKIYGGTNVDVGSSVQQTTDGGYIISGNTASFGAGNNDIVLIKINAQGDAQWTKTYGGTGIDKSNNVRQTSDGGYIITGSTGIFGSGNSDVYLIKTDANGDTLWSKTYGDTLEDTGFFVQQTTDGGYIITGRTFSFGAGNSDVYLIKTNPSGDTLWTKTYGGIYWDYGSYVQQTADGGYIITGHTNSFGVGYYDVYLIKTNTSGDTLWTKIYDSINDEMSYSVKQTADGGYIITGQTGIYSSNLFDVYLLKTDSIGDILWSKTFGGAANDKGSSVQQTIDGGYIIVGQTQSFGAGYYDIYLIKTDSNGDTLWTRTFGGVGLDNATSIQQTTDSGFIIAGYTENFGFGIYDIYLIKTNAFGYSGCNEYSTNTVVTNTVTSVNTTTTITGSGATIKNIATTVGNPIPIDSLLCFSPVSIQEKNNSLKNTYFYPNPFSAYTTMEFNNYTKEKHTLSVYNSLGQLVRQIDNISNGQVRIEKDNLSNGLYFFQLRTDRGIIENGKLIIE